MSGAEAIVVLGVISSVIAIIDGTRKVFDAATDIKGLPKEFREAADRLPIVRNILGSAKQSIEKGDVDEESCRGVQNVVKACETKARHLDELFHKVLPAEGASRRERYLLAFRTLGKGTEVEKLMKGMLDDVQLLASERGMRVVPDDQQEQEDRKQSCLTALFLTDPKDDREKLIQTKGSLVSGTCDWIKANELYISWLRSPHSQLLWLSGGPGKGKTMLSIFIAEDLERAARRMPDVTFLQYFCDDRDEKRSSAVAIIRGLMFQLLNQRPTLVNHILPSFQTQKESLFSASAFETLWRVFQSMVLDPNVGTVYCILDGLDECDHASLEVLLQNIRAFFRPTSGESSSYRLKLILVSREYPDFILEILSGFLHVRLDSDTDSEVHSALKIFIDVKDEELAVFRHYPKSLCAYIERVFLSRAGGTFLWVGIVATELKKYKMTEVEAALDRFPSGLEKLYNRLLLLIDVSPRVTAAKILLWVINALRPLNLLELGAAIEASPTPYIDLDEVVRDQVSYCGSFLTIREGFVELVHQSAKEYFFSNPQDLDPTLKSFFATQEAANLQIARQCFYCICDHALPPNGVDLKEPENSSFLTESPLLLYAAVHWPAHARSLNASEAMFDVTLPFYDENSMVRRAWFRTFWASTRFSKNEPSESFTLLHLTSFFGLLPLAENLFMLRNRQKS